MFLPWCYSFGEFVVLDGTIKLYEIELIIEKHGHILKCLDLVKECWLLFNDLESKAM